MEVEIKINDEGIKGILEVPKEAKGIVIFSHGSGSGRLSPRNNFVAKVLQKAGIATLLIDLLTPEEGLDRRNVFDIPLLTERLKLATEFIQKKPLTKKFAIGYFGASTGAASALRASAALGSQIKAVVSRGGRPDMAMEDLPQVKSPTLLIVGSLDDVVIGLNREAYEKLNCEKELKIIPGASHLFEEPGKLEEVANLAAEWFLKYLG